MPEFSLSFGLHLHHCGVGVLDVLQRFLNSRKQVNDLLLADQDLTVGRKEDEGKVSRRAPDIRASSQGSYLRCVYRSLRTLSWFWTVWMMAFTISVLSVLVSVSGAGGGKVQVHQRIPLLSAHIRLTHPYFCISSSAACRARWPFLRCNQNKYRCIIDICHTENKQFTERRQNRTLVIPK